MTKNCIECGVKLTKKNSVPNGMGGIRNMCREDWKAHQRELSAKRKLLKTKKVVKEVNAPTIKPERKDIFKVIAKSKDREIEINFVNEIDMESFRDVIHIIDQELGEHIKEKNYYKKNAVLFTVITGILGAGLCLVAGLNAFGVLNLFK